MKKLSNRRPEWNGRVVGYHRHRPCQWVSMNLDGTQYNWDLHICRRILISTNFLTRGLDVQQVSLVIYFDLSELWRTRGSCRFGSGAWPSVFCDGPWCSRQGHISSISGWEEPARERDLRHAFRHWSHVLYLLAGGP